jgi:CheY-like chemotaxis protein
VKARILVIEDNPLNRELLCDWLETEGYEVASTADLKPAFELVRSQKPQAVLVDSSGAASFAEQFPQDRQ